MRTVVAREFTFDASHQLPNHNGKCRNLHGHTYTVWVAVSGPVHPHDGEPREGMVVDFGDLKQVMKSCIDKLDHHHLNEIIPVPSAERISEWIFRDVSRVINEWSGSIVVESVRVFEGKGSYAETRQ